MNPDDWIIVPNWDKYQHYKDKQPGWIKLYTAALAHSPKWESLSLAAKGMLATIWIEYALSGGACSCKAVAKQCGRGYKVEVLKSLNHAGFIEFSSRPEKRREETTVNHARGNGPAEALSGFEPMERLDVAKTLHGLVSRYE